MADRLVLVGTGGAVAGRIFAIPDGQMQIGRSPENDVILDEPGVSRFHARLMFDNGTLWVREAGSRNGVFVNGQRVAEHRALSVGDVIRIAELELTVRWETPDLASPPPAGKDEDNPSGPTGSGRGKRRWFWM